MTTNFTTNSKVPACRHARARACSTVVLIAVSSAGLSACMTTQERSPEPLAAHPTEPVATSELAAPPAYASGQQAVAAPVMPDPSTQGGPLQLHAGARSVTAQTPQQAPASVYSPTAPVPAPNPAPVQAAPQEAPSQNRLTSFLDSLRPDAAPQPARAPNPVEQLRRARELPASQGTGPQASAQQYPVMIGENSRLVPTYSDGLPVPANHDGIVTGSVTPRTPQPAPPAEPVRLASVAPAQGVISAPSQSPARVPLPTRTEPQTLRFAPGQISLDQGQRAQLDQVAARYAGSNGKVHIFGISRGTPGDRTLSSERIRRLISQTSAAARYLTERGLNQDQFVLKTLEERIPRRYFGSETPQDQDRLEIFVE